MMLKQLPEEFATMQSIFTNEYQTYACVVCQRRTVCMDTRY